MGLVGHFVGMGKSAARVTRRRAAQGPLRPGWRWHMEVIAEHMKALSRRTDAFDLLGQRAVWDSTAAPSAVGHKLRRARIEMGGVPAEWFVPRRGADDRVLFYLHGGAYIYGSVRTHQELIGRLALAAAARALALDYRLAPEHPFPAAIDDAVAAFRALTKETDPSRIVIAGDSAGGNLALATMLTLRDAGDRMPAAAVLLCPWVDLTAVSGSIVAHEPYDFATPAHVEAWAKGYLADADPRCPRASPVFAELSGLPPLLVHVGSAEMLFDQIKAFVEQARATEVEVELEIAPDMIHNWHVFASFLPEARRSIDQIGDFARRHVR
jgi:epsilon-lactone hydrolase